MKTKNVLKFLSILYVIISVNSDLTEENDLESRANRRIPVKKRYSKGKVRATVRKHVKPVNRQHYPMAPTQQELNDADKDYMPGSYPESEPESVPESIPESSVITINGNGGVAEPENSAFNQNQEPFANILMSLLDPHFIQMFSEIMSKLVTNILPMFANGHGFARELATAMSALNVPRELSNSVADQSSRYFEQMKSQPDSIRPIMIKVLTETLNNFNAKHENPQKNSPKQKKPMSKTPQKKPNQHA